jgi:hypothetical protein
MLQGLGNSIRKLIRSVNAQIPVGMLCPYKFFIHSQPKKIIWSGQNF